MSNKTTRRVLFRQADLARAIKGAKAGGLEVGRVEIEDRGRIVIVPKGVTVDDDLDRELEEFESKHG